jgi:hypothetical protein
MRRLPWALGVLLLVPLVHAQGPGEGPPAELVATADAQLPNGRLMPETGQAVVALELVVGCAVPPARTPSEVVFALESTAPYASVVLNPPSTTVWIPPEKCLDSAFRERVRSQAVVVTNREAPAMMGFDTNITASITSEDGQYGPYRTGFRLTNDFLPLTLLNPVTLFKKAAPNTTVVFPYEAQNLANGPVRIEISASEPNDAKLASIETGVPIRLESRARSGASAAFKEMRTIEVVTPDSTTYTNSIYSFNVKFTTVYDGEDDPTLASDEQTMAFAVQVQGGGVVGAPAFSPLAPIVALGVVMMLRRRRP